MSPALQSSVLLIAATAVSLVGGAEWSYKDESHWGGACHMGKQQSPIDLGPLTATVAQYDKFSFINYASPTPVNLMNDGHTVELRMQKQGSLALSGGGLTGVYYMAQMHFHWGSEHTIQGRRSPLELHLVHYGKQYSGVVEASLYPEGVAVIGIFFKESLEHNHQLDPLIAALKQVDNQVKVPFPMSITLEPILPGDLKTYYRYQGSLTTPGCNETVVWTVMMATIPISKTQLQSFVTLRANSKTIGNNYRSTQPLNGRTLTTTQPRTSSVIRLTPVTSLLFALALIVHTV